MFIHWTLFSLQELFKLASSWLRACEIQEAIAVMCAMLERKLNTDMVCSAKKKDSFNMLQIGEFRQITPYFHNVYQHLPQPFFHPSMPGRCKLVPMLNHRPGCSTTISRLDSFFWSSLCSPKLWNHTMLDTIVACMISVVNAKALSSETHSYSPPSLSSLRPWNRRMLESLTE